MFCVTGNSLYLAHKEEVLWPEKENPQVRSTVFSTSSWKTGWTPEDLFGEDGLLKRMKKRMAEADPGSRAHRSSRLRETCPRWQEPRQLTQRQDHQDAQRRQRRSAGRDPPGPRGQSFDPKLIRKYQTRWPDFDDKIISMYARGMSTRDIQGHIEDLYGVSISPELVSRITDAVTDEALAWQSRPLDPVYPILFLDALFVKVRQVAAAYGTRRSTWPLGVQPPRRQGTPGPLDRAERRGKVLAPRTDRTEEPGRCRYLHRLLRRPHRLPPGHRDGVPQDPGAALHRTHGA